MASAAEGSEHARAIELKSAALASTLLTRRHYIEAHDATGYTFDPRFLLYEFTHNILLRKPQVELINEFVLAVRSNRPLVKQCASSRSSQRPSWLGVRV